MIRVRFLKTWQMYNAGDCAGFAAERAAELIAAGIAVDVEAVAESASLLVEGANVEGANKAAALAEAAIAEVAAKAEAEALAQAGAKRKA